MSTAPAFLLQITIDSTNKWIEVDLNPGGAPDVKTVSITEDDYADIRAVASALETALQVEDATFSVTVGSTGTITIARTGNFTIQWKTGATHGSDNDDDHIGTVLGFDDTADDSGAATYDSDNQCMYSWFPPVLPTDDTYDRVRSLGGATFVPISGLAERCTWGTQTIRELELGFIPRAKFFNADADTNESFEDFWTEAAGGTPFKFYLDATDYVGSYSGQYKMICKDNEDLLDGLPRVEKGSEYYGPKRIHLVKQD